MTDDEVIGIAVQGARYLDAAQQDIDLNLKLTHFNYAVAYFDAATRYATPERISTLTGIDVPAAVDLAQRGQNETNLNYMKKLGIPIRIPFVGGSGNIPAAAMGNVIPFPGRTTVAPSSQAIGPIPRVGVVRPAGQVSSSGGPSAWTIIFIVAAGIAGYEVVRYYWRKAGAGVPHRRAYRY